MKPRLFWTMLLAFLLVIVLGVCGMLSFFGLAVAGVWQPDQPRVREGDFQQGYASFLADYYIAHGNSWQGIDQRLDEVLGRGPLAFVQYTLVDQNGKIVASSNPAIPTGRAIDQFELMHGTPIIARGQRVGTLLTGANGAGSSGFPPRPPSPPQSPDAAPSGFALRRPPSFVFGVLRGFLGAGIGLTLVLLLLAVLFARWLSRPLRRLREASQSLAAGQLDVRVPGARVRELDDLANAFNSMAATLGDADRQRRQMTADIAHELRTPLTIIKGRLEGMQDGIYDATPEQIQQLVNETALLERLVEDLRVLALAEAGQLPLYSELVEPRDLLDHAATAFAYRAAAQGVTLRVEAADDLPLIDADPQRMAQVLSNLLSNSLRHTPSGGSIVLEAQLLDRETRRQGDKETGKLYSSVPQFLSSPVPQSIIVHRPSSIVMKVSDTGTGIPAADLPHIFDRFWRSDGARARGSGGSGLGLAIARQIVVAHGGAIHAESAEAQGTTICIVLPLADDDKSDT